jgi:hypothetical protein
VNKYIEKKIKTTRFSLIIMLPFYRIKRNVWLEAHLLKLMKPLERLWLIMKIDECVQPSGSIEPLPYDEVKQLIMEAKTWIDNNIQENRRNTQLDSLEHMYLPLYNPGRYMAKIEKQLTNITVLTAISRLYDEVLHTMPSKSLGIGWVDVSIIDGDVYICGKQHKYLSRILSSNNEALIELIRIIRGKSS